MADFNLTDDEMKKVHQQLLTGTIMENPFWCHESDDNTKGHNMHRAYDFYKEAIIMYVGMVKHEGIYMRKDNKNFYNLVFQKDMYNKYVRKYDRITYDISMVRRLLADPFDNSDLFKDKNYREKLENYLKILNHAIEFRDAFSHQRKREIIEFSFCLCGDGIRYYNDLEMELNNDASLYKLAISEIYNAATEYRSFKDKFYKFIHNTKYNEYRLREFINDNKNNALYLCTVVSMEINPTFSISQGYVPAEKYIGKYYPEYGCVMRAATRIFTEEYFKMKKEEKKNEKV